MIWRGSSGLSAVNLSRQRMTTAVTATTAAYPCYKPSVIQGKSIHYYKCPWCCTYQVILDNTNQHQSLYGWPPDYSIGFNCFPRYVTWKENIFTSLVKFNPVKQEVSHKYCYTSPIVSVFWYISLSFIVSLIDPKNTV